MMISSLENFTFSRTAIDKWMLKSSLESHKRQNQLDHFRMNINDKRSRVQKIYSFIIDPLMYILYTNQTMFSIVFYILTKYYKRKKCIVVQDKYPLSCALSTRNVISSKGFLILNKDLQVIDQIQSVVFVDNSKVEIQFKKSLKKQQTTKNKT